MGTTADQARPSISAGTATTRPAIGPAAAMSKSAFRLRVGDRIWMMAPIVPNRNRGGGAGMK